MAKLDEKLLGLDDVPVTGPGGETSTLKQLVEHALLNPGRVLDEEESLRLWQLAKQVHLTGYVPREAQALVRAACSRLYGPLAVGRICEAMEEVPPSEPAQVVETKVDG